MPRKAISEPHRGTRVARAVIAVFAVVVVARTFWISPVPDTVSTAVSNVAIATPESAITATSSADGSPQQAEIDRLVAQVATVCPTSAMQLRQELTAAANVTPPYKLTSQRVTSAQARITGVRVAQRPAVGVESELRSAGKWLIDPQDWFTPEDTKVSEQMPPSAEVLSGQELAQPKAVSEVVVEKSEASAPVSSPEPDPPAGPALLAPSPPELPDVVAPRSSIEQRPLPAMEATRAESPSFEPPRVKSSEPELATGESQLDSAESSIALPSPSFQGEIESSQPKRSVEPLFSAPTHAVIEGNVRSDVVDLRSADDTRAEAEMPVRPKFEPLPLPPSPQMQRPKVQSQHSDANQNPTPRDATSQSGFGPPPLGMPSMHGGVGSEGLDMAREKARAAGVSPGEDPHAVLFAEGCYPSAKTCAKCHEKVYNEWSCSSHAYAMVSPMFHKFEQKITEVSMGTVGYFCLRCHSPVGTHLNLPRDMPLWQQPEVAREGVTCVACHRVNQRYGKSNGERHIVPGDIYAPVYGGKGGVGVAQVIAQKDHYKVKTSPEEKGPGQPIHREGRYFDQLSAAEYCTTCHQVAVHPGIKLEVVWEQYRASPARKAGVTCQDCHMGKTPGVPSGYECCAIAEVAGKKVRENVKHSNHTFYGPGYSIAHPGIFPFHLKADRWKFNEWLEFDWRAGWGADEFEDRVADGEIRVRFPAVWAEVDDRYDAREIIDDNLERLAGKTEIRKQVMENGSHVDGPYFATPPRVGQDLKLHYVVANTNSGHNLPTASLGAQPQLWANVVLIGPRGQRLWETGYTDHYGDVCDIHSRDVRNGRVPFDSQLFNLQTMFLITGATGTDREFFLPVNVDFDQLPFLRPGAIPISVTNHPPFIRMESRSIAPLGKKKVKYSIPGKQLSEPGRYRLSFRMRSRAEPIYFMDFCGATTEMQRAMNEGVIDVHPYAVEFEVR